MATIYERKSALFISADTTSDKFDVSPGDSIFRIGNKNDSKLDHIRPRDVDKFTVQGKELVKVNNKGLSILTLKGIINYTEVNSKVGSRSSNWAEFISNSALETLSYWRCQINRGKKREKT